MFNKNQTITEKIAVIVLLFISLILLWPMLSQQFTNWDDGLYVLHNPYIRNFSFNGIGQLFKTFCAGNYHPLTMLSLSLDYKLGGTLPEVYKITNLLFHLANTLLVYIACTFILHQITGETKKVKIVALFVTTLFAMHPMQVESVVWISERKNLVFTFFFLLSVIAYIRYCQLHKSKWLFLSIVFFILSTLSKATAVSLTPLLFIVDWVYNRSWKNRNIFLEKLPFLVISIIIGIVSIYAQHSEDAIRTNDTFNFFDRICIAAYGFICYPLKMIFPVKLSCYYPYPVKQGFWLPIQFYLPLMVLVTTALLFWRKIVSSKLAVFGTGFYLLNIALVLQLIPVGDAIIADRYFYLPSVGLFILLGYIFFKIYQMQNGRLWFVLAILPYFTFLSIITRKQVRTWDNSMALWNHSLEVFPENNDRGYLNRGNLYYEANKFELAEADYLKVLEIDLKNAGALIGMGLIESERNNISEAEVYFDKAITYHTTHEGFLNRAALRIKTGNYKGALEDLNYAETLDPFRTGIYNNRGVIYLNIGQIDKARKNFEKALTIEANNYYSYLGMGRVEQASGNFQLALDYLNLALTEKVNSDVYLVRSDVKMLLKDFDGARLDLQSAIAINPNKPDAYINLGILELTIGNFPLAFGYYNQAVSLNRSNSQAYFYRGIACLDINEPQQAIFDLDTSLILKENGQAYFYRGLAYKRLGDKHKACFNFLRADSLRVPEASNELKNYCK